MDRHTQAPRALGHNGVVFLKLLLLTAVLLVTACGPQTGADGSNDDVNSNTTDTTPTNGDGEQWDSLTWDEGDWS